MEYTKPLAKLIEEFQKLPGVGPKSAQRMALHLIRFPIENVSKFAEVIMDAKKQVQYCSICCNLSALNPCEICSDSTRDHQTICVITSISDLIALEKTREFKGSYHVIQGVISPLDGIGPEELKIKELLQRIKIEDCKEIIIAINPSVEGEATTLYLKKLLKPLNIKLTCIAYGLPVGCDLEYADEATLTRALLGRQEL